MEKYILPFLVSFLLSVILIFLFGYFGKKIKWQGRNSKRHIKKNNVSRLGGAAIIISFVVALVLDKNLVFSSELCGFIIASGLILIFGIIDDVKELFWKFQLFFQIVVSVLVFIFGVRIYFITNPLTGGVLNLDSEWGVIFSIFLAIFWIILVMNAVNWIDGIDGLSGGISLIAVVTIFFLSLKPEVNQPPIAIITAALAGSVLGFLLFNFYPSRILAGTAGSMFMGFSLATLSIFSGAKIATSLLVLFVPIIDFFWVILLRIRQGRSVFLADNNHLHHRLLSLGWSQKKINGVFLGITALIAVVALNTSAMGKGVALLIFFIIMASSFLILNRKVEN